MRRLSTPGGHPSGSANGVNTHRRVVGSNEGFLQPFYWTPDGGVRGLPTLGGDLGLPQDLNEFGQIAGASVTAGGAVRAVVWIPTAGPLVMAPKDEDNAD